MKTLLALCFIIAGYAGFAVTSAHAETVHHTRHYHHVYHRHMVRHHHHEG